MSFYKDLIQLQIYLYFKGKTHIYIYILDRVFKILVQVFGYGQFDFGLTILIVNTVKGN